MAKLAAKVLTDLELAELELAELEWTELVWLGRAEARLVCAVGEDAAEEGVDTFG